MKVAESGQAGAMWTDPWLKEQTDAMLPMLIEIRRRLHEHPELGTGEYETGKIIREYLEQWGIAYSYPCADTGIVAVIEGKLKEEKSEKGRQAAVVGLRADMDALPLEEDPSRPYCSKNPGVMHACGHDAHMTIALGAAWLLKKYQDHWSGAVKIFFQPAEETCGGAERMVNEGCMENPHVDYVLGLHMMPAYEYGEVELKYDDLNASSDEIKLVIKGKNSHGAYPDQGIDAIAEAAAVIQSLQTLVSRRTSPYQNVVLSLGTINGGTAANVVADEVVLTGTLRTTNPQTRKEAKEYISRVTEEICRAYGGQGEAVFTPGYDALINTNEIVDVVIDTVSEALGREHIHFKPFPSLGVEDFSFFLNRAPGAFYHLGCACKEKGIEAPLHNRSFDIDERVLALGVRLQTGLVMRLTEKACSGEE